MNEKIEKTLRRGVFSAFDSVTIQIGADVACISGVQIEKLMDGWEVELQELANRDFMHHEEELSSVRMARERVAEMGWER